MKRMAVDGLLLAHVAVRGAEQISHTYAWGSISGSGSIEAAQAEMASLCTFVAAVVRTVDTARQDSEVDDGIWELVLTTLIRTNARACLAAGQRMAADPFLMVDVLEAVLDEQLSNEPQPAGDTAGDDDTRLWLAASQGAERAVQAAMALAGSDRILAARLLIGVALFALRG